MIIISDLSTDKLRKLYKELKPKMIFADINRMTKDELIEKFDKLSDKKIKQLIDKVDKKYERKSIKTLKDYLESINKYDVRKIGKKLGVTGLNGSKGDVMKGIIDKKITLSEAKKIVETIAS